MIVARLAPPATAALWLLVSSTAYPSGFTVAQALRAPFGSDIVAARAGRELACVSDSRGRSNVWLAAPSQAAGFTARALTHYAVDDGLAIEALAFVPHHDALLFVRGGDPDYPDKPAPHPALITAGVVQTVYLIDFRGREPVKLGEGHAPVASPNGKRFLYLEEGKVFSGARRGGARSEQLFNTRGKVDSLRFSPDGTRLAFVCNRGDHSFVGVYTFAEQALRWVDASFSLDLEPRWSPDGTRLAFLRLRWGHDEVGLIPHRTGDPWSIRVANLTDQSVAEAYRAPRGAGSVFHALSSDVQLVWSGTQLVFPAENDGWLHFYSVPASGGAARLLTPGRVEGEYAAASAEGLRLRYIAHAEDSDRRPPWRP